MQINIIESLENSLEKTVLEKAPYQSVLLVYDFSTPSTTIERINAALNKKCILTKFIISEPSLATLNDLLLNNDFRLLIALGRSNDIFFLHDIEKIQHKIFCPTNYDISQLITAKNQIFVSPKLILHNFDADFCHSFLTILSICSSLTSEIFYAIMREDKQTFYILNNLFTYFSDNSKNLIEINDNEKFLVEYFALIDKITQTFAELGLTISNDEYDIFEKNSLSLKAKLETYFYMFYIQLCTFDKNFKNIEIFDIYKNAKTLGFFNTNYFDYIDYFYDIFIDKQLNETLFKYQTTFYNLAGKNYALATMILKKLNHFMPKTQSINNVDYKNILNQIISRYVILKKQNLISFSKLYNII